MAINLPQYTRYERDIATFRRELKRTPWELNDADEQQLERQLARISTASKLNVEMLVKTEHLRENHRTDPVSPVPNLRQPFLAKLDEIIDRGYQCTRRCLGDGNCYYRAVYYAYFELLIKRGPEAVGHLLEL
jgi:hypothetical protein